MRLLKKLTINGFKSIREQTLVLEPLNLFIGGNGAGKSNLIQLFRFLREIVDQNLTDYVALRGGADTLLHFGRKRTPGMVLNLEFGTNGVSENYDLRLHGTDDDKLMVATETVSNSGNPSNSPGSVKSVARASKESRLKLEDNYIARNLLRYINGCQAYHFHDTSETAAVKSTCEVEDNRFLRPRAENLAAFLYWMQQKQPGHFANVQDTIRQVAPFFSEFRLEPSRLNEARIRLEWKEKGSDGYFNASSFSDGTLRFICLAALLLQPDLPPLVLLDEPELGLHPTAVALLADLLASASTRSQLLVATQSVTLLNQFEPHHIWTVERADNQSVFRHLNDADMSSWLDDYSLGELWEKNILGARP